MELKDIFLLLSLCMIYVSASPDNHLSLYHHHHPSILTDKATLLAFKSTIVTDPQDVLADWLEASYVCNFTGVKCNHRHHRVVELRLNRTGIQGLLSPFLANLTNLRVLDLSENSLSGQIPPEFGSFRRLNELKLSGNSLHGSIPDSLALIPILSWLDIHDNGLIGRIPMSIFYNCTNLYYVDLSNNALAGEIPSEIGNYLTNLNVLNLYSNKLSGEIPPSLSNSSSLVLLDLENNSLSGELPSEIVGRLQDLEYLGLSYNHLSSQDNNTNLLPFFHALSNCTYLNELELAANSLGGALPSSIGLLGTELSSIHLEDNRIFGSILPTIANLSNLTLLNLSSNLFNGTIPVELGQFMKLERLMLSNNSLTGVIPSVLGHINSLGVLDLSMNRLSGKIPDSLGNLTRLSELLLHKNQLAGPIPSTLGKFKSLNKLDLSHNRLTGRIPPEIAGLGDLGIFFNLSNNLLQGPLPLELSKMEDVQEIDLSSNNLTGNIYPQLESCIASRVINLAHNSLQGKLPESLGKLRNLESLDVSNNSLSGEIPPSLGECHSLKQLNLSYNDFYGFIPTGTIFASFTYLSFLGNKHLCGLLSGIPTCRRKEGWWHSRTFVITVSVVASTSAFMLTVYVVIGFRNIKWQIFPRRDDKLGESTPDLKLNFPRITYRELEEATEGFEQGRLIGTGGFGHVYRGILRDGTVVAVKVLHLQNCNSTKSFNRECQVLKRIRHRNLMRIVTACSLPEFKALVLPFMANGSLESHLYPPSTAAVSGSSSSDLNLIQRVNICSDIAEGMAYLHHHSPVRVIHCDLKPSNVLLNDDMTALVSDFGIARLVLNVGGGNGGADNMGNSTANLLCGSIGYIAPEYGFGSNISTKGDVYSFGILVLEMVTRKRPTDDMFVGGLSLHNWVKTHFHGRVERVIDSSLVRSARDQNPEARKSWEVAITELIELGLLCTQTAPSTRPTMLDAADDLDRLKRYLNGDTTATFASSLGISSSTIVEED
ncbi:putative leucine-rich repeat receptor-like serine/threonine-protein kinase At2g24130 [Tasmannia lanceolata]|uniref:putative leucine-rich repeat receptor-like serine/threonine-protein kinase At2g24130 n=1 Tax=Tasmannia lanceolata TaxID=3420 RepID=UPI004064891A